MDTGPLVALFDPKDGEHARCVMVLKTIREPAVTTTPVLTEAFHMLNPASIGSDRLREFIETGGLSVWFFDRSSLTRSFELMELYADHHSTMSSPETRLDLPGAHSAPGRPPGHGGRPP